MVAQMVARWAGLAVALMVAKKVVTLVVSSVVPSAAQWVEYSGRMKALVMVVCWVHDLVEHSVGCWVGPKAVKMVHAKVVQLAAPTDERTVVMTAA